MTSGTSATLRANALNRPPRGLTLFAMTPEDLAAIFLASVEGAFPEASLAADLSARLAAGREAWPELALDDARFVQHLAAHVEAGSLSPIEHAADLFLACACAAGVKGAAAAFERAYRSVLTRAVARIDRAGVDEGLQVVLVSLLVAEPLHEPRIVAYGGRSTLRTWLATVATRATLKLRRRRGDQPHESIGALVESFVADEPALALAKARHAPELALSFRSALAALEPRQLVLLKLHHAKGWSVDRIGGLYGVGRSTAGRWVAAARDALLDGAKDHLRARLNLSTTELESLVALLRSNIDVSLVRLLESDPAGASTH